MNRSLAVLTKYALAEQAKAAEAKLRHDAYLDGHYPQPLPTYPEELLLEAEFEFNAADYECRRYVAEIRSLAQEEGLYARPA